MTFKGNVLEELKKHQGEEVTNSVIAEATDLSHKQSYNAVCALRADGWPITIAKAGYDGSFYVPSGLRRRRRNGNNNEIKPPMVGVGDEYVGVGVMEGYPTVRDHNGDLWFLVKPSEILRS